MAGGAISHPHHVVARTAHHARNPQSPPETSPTVTQRQECSGQTIKERGCRARKTAAGNTQHHHAWSGPIRGHLCKMPDCGRAALKSSPRKRWRNGCAPRRPSVRWRGGQVAGVIPGPDERAGYRHRVPMTAPPRRPRDPNPPGGGDPHGKQIDQTTTDGIFTGRHHLCATWL